VSRGVPLDPTDRRCGVSAPPPHTSQSRLQTKPYGATIITDQQVIVTTAIQIQFDFDSTYIHIPQPFEGRSTKYVTSPLERFSNQSQLKIDSKLSRSCIAV